MSLIWWVVILGVVKVVMPTIVQTNSSVPAKNLTIPPQHPPIIVQTNSSVPAKNLTTHPQHPHQPGKWGQQPRKPIWWKRKHQVTAAQSVALMEDPSLKDEIPRKVERHRLGSAERKQIKKRNKKRNKKAKIQKAKKREKVEETWQEETAQVQSTVMDSTLQAKSADVQPQKPHTLPHDDELSRVEPKAKYERFVTERTL